MPRDCNRNRHRDSDTNSTKDSSSSKPHTRPHLKDEAMDNNNTMALQKLILGPSHTVRRQLRSSSKDNTEPDSTSTSKIPAINHILAPYTIIPSSSLSSSSIKAAAILATTFPHFPLLPGELKNKIWIHAVALTPPRLIIFGSPSIPPLLHTCHDSRSFALESYKIEIWRSPSHPHTLHAFFVNWSKDYVYFPNEIPGLEIGVARPRFVRKPVKGVLGWESHLEQLPRLSRKERKWLAELRNLVISREEARRLFDQFCDSRSGLWRDLSKLCPKLEKIVVLQNYGVELGRDVEMKDLLEERREHSSIERLFSCMCQALRVVVRYHSGEEMKGVQILCKVLNWERIPRERLRDLGV